MLCDDRHLICYPLLLIFQLISRKVHCHLQPVLLSFIITHHSYTQVLFMIFVLLACCITIVIVKPVVAYARIIIASYLEGVVPQ